jgi:hypothetical protein
MQFIFAPFDRKSSAETIRGAAGIKVVGRQSNIQYRRNRTISRRKCCRNMIKTAAKIKIANAIYSIDGNLRKNQAVMLDYLNILSIEVLEKDQATTRYGTKGENGAVITTNKALKALSEIKVELICQKLLFYPNLKTDKSGKLVSISLPEALTAWKLRLFAHNKSSFWLSGKIIVTQKT